MIYQALPDRSHRSSMPCLNFQLPVVTWQCVLNSGSEPFPARMSEGEHMEMNRMDDVQFAVVSVRLLHSRPEFHSNPISAIAAVTAGSMPLSFARRPSRLGLQNWDRSYQMIRNPKDPSLSHPPVLRTPERLLLDLPRRRFDHRALRLSLVCGKRKRGQSIGSLKIISLIRRTKIVPLPSFLSNSGIGLLFC